MRTPDDQTNRPTGHRNATATRRVRQALVALSTVAGTIAITAEAAHAGIQMNHNETAATDAPTSGRRTTATRRVRQALVAMSTVAVSLATMTEIAHAGYGLNHNETAATDG